MDNYRNKFFRAGSAAAAIKKRAALDFAQKIFFILQNPFATAAAYSISQVDSCLDLLACRLFHKKARKSHVNSMQNREEEEDHKEGFTEYSKAATTVVRKCRR